MGILFTLILWTWGLTPTWVNIVGTVIIAINVLAGYGHTLNKK